MSLINSLTSGKKKKKWEFNARKEAHTRLEQRNSHHHAFLLARARSPANMPRMRQQAVHSSQHPQRK